ncbi:hypothetical protein AB4528_10020 [Vibrio breoganii]
MLKIHDSLMLTISNVISLVASLLLVLGLPKVIGVEEFSHWQLYLYWLAFSPLLHLGWVDGVYIIIGRFVSTENNAKVWDKNNFLLFSSFILLLALVITGISVLYFEDNFIFIIVLIFSIFITNIRAYLYSVVQSQGYFKVYAKNVILSNVMQIVFITSSVMFFSGALIYLIVADLLVRLFSTISIYFKVSSDFTNRNVNVPIKNILKMGTPIVIAYIVVIANSSLVRGVFNLKWGVIQFGGLSVMMGIAKVFLLGFQPLTLTMFPILKKHRNDQKQNEYLTQADFLLTYILMFAMLAFYMFGLVLERWLPDYTEFLIFYYLLSAFCFFETRFFSVYVPAIKAKEKSPLLMNVNIGTLCFTFFSCVLFGYIIPNKVMLVMMISVSSLIKIYFIKKSISYEPLMMVKLIGYFIFFGVVSFLFLEGFIVEVFVSYSLVLIIYSYAKREKIKSSFLYVRGKKS